MNNYVRVYSEVSNDGVIGDRSEFKGLKRGLLEAECIDGQGRQAEKDEEANYIGGGSDHNRRSEGRIDFQRAKAEGNEHSGEGSSDHV